MNPMTDTRKVHDADHNLTNAIERHHDIGDPVHEVHQRNPVEIGVVPSLLGREELEAAKNSRNHERQKARVHPVLVLAGTHESDDRYHEEHRGNGRKNALSEPMAEIEDSGLEKHLSPYITCWTSRHRADTVRKPSAAAIRRIAGRSVTKLKIEPMMANPAA